VQQQVLHAIEDPDVGGGLQNLLSRTHGVRDFCNGEIEKDADLVVIYGKEKSDLSATADEAKKRKKIANKIQNWGKLPASEYKEILDYLRIWPAKIPQAQAPAPASASKPPTFVNFDRSTPYREKTVLSSDDESPQQKPKARTLPPKRKMEEIATTRRSSSGGTGTKEEPCTCVCFVVAFVVVLFF